MPSGLSAITDQAADLVLLDRPYRKWSLKKQQQAFEISLSN